MTKPRRTLKTHGPWPVDVHVGNRVRVRRTMLGMSQERLGDALGLTFQQVQKYERGTNRISAGRLHDLTGILDVPVSYFFEDIPPEIAGKTTSKRSHPSHSEYTAEEVETLVKRETLELVRAYYRIGNAAIRQKFFRLIQAVAKTDGD